MNTILILLGESGCGKSTTREILLRNNTGYRFHKVVSYTTRPKREGEKNGEDYYFVSEEQFTKIKEENLFAETGSYRNWHYGSLKKDYESGNAIAILTPHGVRELQKALRNSNCRIFTAYLKVPRRDRLITLLERGDDIEEAYRRNISDIGQFDGIESEADFTIYNEAYHHSYLTICRAILEELDKAEKRKEGTSE